MSYNTNPYDDAPIPKNKFQKDIIDKEQRNQVIQNTHTHVEKSKFDRLSVLFQQDLPNSLYKSAHELSQLDMNTTTYQWEQFLKHPETQRMIERGIAAEMEVAGRKALKDLTTKGGSLSTADINAIKEILANSKIIQEKSQSKESVVLMYLPPRKESVL